MTILSLLAFTLLLPAFTASVLGYLRWRPPLACELSPSLRVLFLEICSEVDADVLLSPVWSALSSLRRRGVAEIRATTVVDEAVTAASDGSVDVVLLEIGDLRAPWKEAVSVIGEVQSSIPLLVIGPDGEQNWKSALQVGAERYLVRDAYLTAQTLEREILHATELKRIMNELRAMQAEVDHALRSKDNVLGNIRHELCTPLSVILGFAEFIKENQVSAEDSRSALEAIIRNGNHLHRLIARVLDVAKVKEPVYEVQNYECNPREALEEIEIELGTLAVKKGLFFKIVYETELPQVIGVEQSKFKRVMYELCENAVKFTERGGVSIFVFFDAQEQQLWISVSDTGIGMEERKISWLFTPFVQGEVSERRRFGGMGIGLALVKEFTQCMNAEIIIRSELTRGSIVSLLFDLTPRLDLSEEVTSRTTRQPQRA